MDRAHDAQQAFLPRKPENSKVKKILIDYQENVSLAMPLIIAALYIFFLAPYSIAYLRERFQLPSHRFN